MSAVELLEPILDGVQRNNFFNGRLLSAEDLRAEQDATRVQHRNLANAIGDGVAWGLDVTLLSAESQHPRVTVTRGLALNRAGDLLHLRNDSEVTLVPSAQAQAVGAGLFAKCDRTPGMTVPFTGEGAYVLVVSPASGYRGTALVSDPNTTAVGRGSCGPRFNVEGLRFRLVPMVLSSLSGIGASITGKLMGLLPPDNAIEQQQLRNLLAHACFGTEALSGYFANPVEPLTDAAGPAGWGAIDAMRFRHDLTDCDVPLALVVMTGKGISFVDVWSARRRLIDATAIEDWRAVAGPRRLAEGEAAFLQFQAQLGLVKSLEPASTRATVVASKYFHYLPAAGWLPTGTGGFGWKAFLGPHAPPAVTPVDPALLRGTLERSWFDEPFRLDTDPPVPLRVYKVPGVAGQSFVVFARSNYGNVRVVLTPPPLDSQSVEVQAKATIGSVVRSATLSGGRVPLLDLVPGSHTLTVTAPDYLPVPNIEVTAIGGRTVDVGVGLSPLPNGIIVVNAFDKSSNESIDAKVTSVTASAGGVDHTGEFEGSSGKWVIADLPPGAYTVKGTANGYKVATSGSVTTARGARSPATLVFEREKPPKGKPQRCIKLATIKPPLLTNVTLCMVLSATEFEDAYYYGARPAHPLRNRIASGKFHVAGRSRSARKRSETRYPSEDDVIVYSEAPWEDMVPLQATPAEDAKKWLHDWRDWFADELGDEEIRKAEPKIYIDPKFAPPKNAATVRRRPPAYAVFSHFGVPLIIKLEDRVTKGPVKIEWIELRGLRRDLPELFYKVEIFLLEDLAGLWTEFIGDLTGGDDDPERYLIADAIAEIPKIDEELKFLPGVDKDLAAKMKAKGYLDLVSLANADPKKLVVDLGLDPVADLGFVIRLIQQVQEIVPRESWSLEGVVPDHQVEDFEDRGIGSKGILLDRATPPPAGADPAVVARKAEEKEEVLELLGIDAEPAEVQEAAVTGLTTELATAITRSSVALLATIALTGWKGIDTLTAFNLNAAGYSTLDDVAKTPAATIAAAANLSIPAAENLVKDALAESRLGRAAGVVATVSPAAAAELNLLVGGTATLGLIATMPAANLAGAFGGNLGLASAIVSGINAGLAGGRFQ